MERTILLCFSVSLVQFSSAFCPHECVCDDYSLEASCIKSNLEVNIENPEIKKTKNLISEKDFITHSF